MRKAIARITLATLVAVAASAAWSMEIVVGQVGPMSGLEANQGRAYATGMELVFKNVNKAGGLNGHRFSLVRKDDRGVPEQTVSATRELIAESKPLVLAGYFGNQNIADLVASGVLQNEKIALVGYRAWHIRADAPLMYNVRAGAREEIRKIIEHLATIGIMRIGLLYEEGVDAANVVTVADDAARKSNAKLVVRASYPSGTTTVMPAIDQFIKTPPQAILLVATGATVAGFVDLYRAAGGGAQIFTHSGADVEQMAKRLSDEQMQGVVIAQVVPSPYRITSQIAKDFNAALAGGGKPDVPVSYAMMEGFIAAKVIVEAVRRQGRTPTREGLVAALDSMDNFDVGGYMVGYKSGSRSGSKYVELSIVAGAGKIRQ